MTTVHSHLYFVFNVDNLKIEIPVAVSSVGIAHVVFIVSSFIIVCSLY